MPDKDNYYDDYSCFSFSLYKRFMACEAAAMAEIRGEYEPAITDAMLMGSYVDAALTGDIDIFMSCHADIFTGKGELKAQYKLAQIMVGRALSDPLFVEYLQGDKQRIVTGEISGVPVKGKLDILHPERIVDVKTARDFQLVWDGASKTTFIEAWGYDIQGAIYQELVRQATGRKLPYYIAAITKDAVPDIEIIHIPDSQLSQKLNEVKHFLPELQAVKIGLTEPIRCGKCDYCKRTKVLTQPIELEEFWEVWA